MVQVLMSADRDLSCAQAAVPANIKLRAHRLTAVRAGILGPRAVVGRFLRNDDVMGMTLLYRCPADENEAGACLQFLQVFRSAIAHSRPEAAYKLIHEWRQVAFERNPAFDSFRHELNATAVLTVAVVGAGHHRSQGTHAAVSFATPSFINNGLTRALCPSAHSTAD